MPATKTKSKKNVEQTSPEVVVIFSTFDTGGNRPLYRTIVSSSVYDWVPVHIDQYNPYGSTPLRDATSQFIDDLNSYKKTGTVVIGCLADESGSMMGNEKSVVDGINEFVGGMSDIDVDPDSDGKILAVILTDGFENASTEITASGLAKKIAKCEKEDWTFIYLGANQDAWSVGENTGFSGGARGQTFNYASTPLGTASGLSMATNSASQFLSSNAAYEQMSASKSSGTITEDGTVLDQSGNEYDIATAVEEAKKGKK